LIAGLLFGVGLVVSRMVDPAKVLGFLDVGAIASGGWDPSLAFVMGGALLVNAPLVWLARRRGRPLLAPPLALPAGSPFGCTLLLGAAPFGATGGLVGYCPGRALAAFGFGASNSFGFVVAMLGGMVVHQAAIGRRDQ